jgi:hypothetical protein
LVSGGGVPLVLEVDLALRSSGCSARVGDDDVGGFSPVSGSLPTTIQINILNMSLVVSRLLLVDKA